MNFLIVQDMLIELSNWIKFHESCLDVMIQQKIKCDLLKDWCMFIHAHLFIKPGWNSIDRMQSGLGKLGEIFCSSWLWCQPCSIWPASNFLTVRYSFVMLWAVVLIGYLCFYNINCKIKHQCMWFLILFFSFVMQTVLFPIKSVHSSGGFKSGRKFQSIQE